MWSPPSVHAFSSTGCMRAPSPDTCEMRMYFSVGCPAAAQRRVSSSSASSAARSSSATSPVAVRLHASTRGHTRGCTHVAGCIAAASHPRSVSFSRPRRFVIEVLTYTYRPDASSTAKPFALSRSNAANNSGGGIVAGDDIGGAVGGVAVAVGSAISRTLAARRVACRARGGRGTKKGTQVMVAPS